VAIVSSRIFTGDDLCHNEEWLKVAIGYTHYVFLAAQAVKSCNPLLRPFVFRFLPDVRKLWELRSTAYRLLTPIIRARIKASKRQGYTKPSDMLQWTMDARDQKGISNDDYETLVQQQLALTFSSLHTTSMAVTNMIFDLAAMPEYILILRDEIQEGLKETGGMWDGKLMKTLKKTDSFMKESQRHNPIAWSKHLLR
jgi:cytochrome P450